jgi:ABC-type enterochelin transport system substrate-binding protein
MNKIALTLLSAITALGFTSCDKAKEEVAGAEAKAKALAAEATAKAKAAAPDLQAKATEALNSAKTAGAGALTKGGELLDTAKDWGLEKMGVPEADGLLDGFKSLIDEAKTTVQGGMNGEKASALKGKWDTLYTKANETITNLAPDKQEKLKAILAMVKTKWDELMAKAGTAQ